MALSEAVQGARHTSQRVTWLDEDGDPQDLNGATLSGRLLNRATGTAANMDGTFNIVDAAGGVFDWTPGVNDVSTPGVFDAQFIATYGVVPNTTNDKTLVEKWTVHRAI
jgi:hypothetical protein